MKKVIIALLLALASCKSESLENRAAWGNTYWGMSPEEIAETVEQKLSPINENSKNIFCYEEDKKYCDGSSIEGYSIGSQNYTVSFIFIAEQLKSVYLHCIDNKYVCYTELGNLLEAKYGKPAEVESESSDSIERQTKTWSTESKNIRLLQSVCSPLSNYHSQCYESLNSTILYYDPNPQHLQATTPEFIPEEKKNKN